MSEHRLCHCRAHPGAQRPRAAARGAVGSQAALTLLWRTFSKRTLAKLNALDFVVTVALGSILASSLLSRNVALAESLTASAVLIVLQYMLLLELRSLRSFSKYREGPANVAVFRGRFLHDSLRRERVSVEEVRFAMRQAGVARQKA